MQPFLVIITSFIFLILLTISVVTVFFGAPIVLTDSKSLYKMMKLIGTVNGKRVIDLGSGDGRVVIWFAKHGAYVVGVEINLVLALISLLKIKLAHLDDKAKIFWKSFWGVNLAEFDIVNIYGISYIMPKLRDKLSRELKTGSLVISHAYKIPGWKEFKSDGTIFIYRIGV